MQDLNPEQLGIPTLDLTMQAAELVEPIIKWGAIARSKPMTGTYHFYSDPGRWSALMANPHRLPAVGCSVAVEPNYPTRAGQPLAEVLALVCRKRLIARAWQDAGVRIVMDLAVDPAWREHNLLGVPRGWASYANRCRPGYQWSIEQLRADHDRAVEHADGNPILYAVFGGGAEAAAICDKQGWTHVPEALHQVALGTKTK